MFVNQIPCNNDSKLFRGYMIYIRLGIIFIEIIHHKKSGEMNGSDFSGETLYNV